jgi:hypothetical protein
MNCSIKDYRNDLLTVIVYKDSGVLKYATAAKPIGNNSLMVITTPRPESEFEIINKDQIEETFIADSLDHIDYLLRGNADAKNKQCGRHY